MKSFKDKIVPDFIVRPSKTEFLDDAKRQQRLELVPVQMVDGVPVVMHNRVSDEVGPDGTKLIEVDRIILNRAFLRFCKNVRDLSSDAIREFFESTVMVAKIMWDEKTRRWDATRFTEAETRDFLRRASEHKPDPMVIQYGKAKWLTGGGRSARAAGCFFYAKTDVTSELYKKYLQVDPTKLSARDKVARSPILFSPHVAFNERPVVKMSQNEHSGIVFVSEAFASRNGVSRGDKLWPIKGSAEIVPSNIAMDADIVVPKDAVKFQEHADNPALVSELAGFVPGLTAKERCSEEKGRIPRLALDILQFMHPNIMTFFRKDAKTIERLDLVRRVVEGRASIEETLALGEYTTKTGEKGYPMEFQFLAKGQPMEERRIRHAVFAAAGTAAFKALTLRVGGGYGVAMPLRGSSRKRLGFLPPIMLPMWVETELDNNVVGVDSDWVVGCLGKDFDGDLAIVLQLDWLLKQVGLGKNLFPDWTNQEDKKWLGDNLTWPTKEKANDPRDVHQVMIDGLNGYGLIGRATNACMVILDALRMKKNANGEALLSPRQLMGTYLDMMSTKVQKFVDSLKYVPGGMAFEGLAGLARYYGVDPKAANRLGGYFKAIRGMDFDALASLPEDKELEGSFYYDLASLFRGWKPVPEVDMMKVAAEVLLKHPASQGMDDVRRGSFRLHGNNLEERLKAVAHLLTNDGTKVAFAALCWAKNDTSLALAVEKLTGFRAIDAWKLK